MNEKILILGRQWAILEELEEIVRSEGYVVSKGICSLEAIDTLLDDSFTAVITDFVVPGMDGLTFLKKIKAVKNDIVILILTGSATFDSALQALRDGGVDDFLMLPLESVDILKKSLDRFITKKNDIK